MAKTSRVIKSIKWNEVVMVKWKPSLKYLVLKDETGKKIILHKTILNYQRLVNDVYENIKSNNSELKIPKLFEDYYYKERYNV